MANLILDFDFLSKQGSHPSLAQWFSYWARSCGGILESDAFLSIVITVQSVEPLGRLTHLPVDILLEPGFAHIVSAQLLLEISQAGLSYILRP